jgi:TolB-like protein
MEQLRRVLIREEVVHAIARESEIAGAEIPEGTVAVPDFLNPSESDTLRALAKGLGVMVLTDLAQVEQLRVVERQRISTLLAEMELTQGAMVRVRTEEGPDALATVRGQKQRLARLHDPQTGKAFYDGPVDDDAGEAFVDAIRAFQASAGLTADGVVGPRTRAALEEAWNRLPPEDREVGARSVAVFDPNTVPRVGRLLGAREIVQGSVVPVGREEVQISADLVPVVSGGRSGSTEVVEGEIEEVLALQERLVYSILDALGIEPTREERKRIGRQETDSFAAFFAYCRGLDLEDQGRQGEALSLYERALSIDPGFRLAAEAAAVISTGPDDLGAIESGSAPSAPTAGGGDAATRAAGTAGRVGLMPMFDPLPQIDPVTPDPVRAESENGRIIVIGEIPGSGGGKP